MRRLAIGKTNVAPFDQVVVTIGTYVSPSAITVAVK
jgi:hypothetical protein